MSVPYQLRFRKQVIRIASFLLQQTQLNKGLNIIIISIYLFAYESPDLQVLGLFEELDRFRHRSVNFLDLKSRLEVMYPAKIHFFSYLLRLRYNPLTGCNIRLGFPVCPKLN